MENVLIIGANGGTGRKIAQRLKSHADYTPYAMIRKEEQKEYFDQRGIKTVIGDLEEDFRKCYKGIDKVIFAAGSGGSTGDDKTKAIDELGAKNAIQIAEDKEIKKFVLLSSMGTDQPDSIPGLKVYLKAKKASEEFLEKMDVNYTIIQPGGLKNDEGTGKIQAQTKIKEFGTIPRADVAYALVVSLNDNIAHNKAAQIIAGDQEVEKAMGAI
jgi:uncharacterized protein YbjT (DUF2867 family)